MKVSSGLLCVCCSCVALVLCFSCVCVSYTTYLLVVGDISLCRKAIVLVSKSYKEGIKTILLITIIIQT